VPIYTYQVETTTETVLGKVKDSELKFVGRGGVADVYLHDLGTIGKFALKIYRNQTSVNWDKISYQVSNPFEGLHSVIDPQIPKLAWPLSIIKSEGKNCGVVMPYVDRQDFITLDNWVEFHLLQKLKPENDSLGRRILLLANLADLLTKLHKSYHSVIDLKPSNILVFHRTGDICLIDCDSFRIKEKKGKVFPGTHVSPGYILPEACGDKLDIPKLREKQDRYAYAVIAFQVLNYGIHPFQGILSSSIKNIETNDQKAKEGLYAYGRQKHPLIIPLSQSVHATWPEELREHFDAAFLRERVTPKASDWAGYFREILYSKSLSRCEAHPKIMQHIHFDGQNCSACSRLEAINKLNPSQKTAKTTPKKTTPKKKKPTPQRGNQKSTPVSKKQVDKSPEWAVMTSFGIVILIIILGAIFSGESNNQAPSTTPTDTTYQPSSPRAQASEMAGRSNYSICQKALHRSLNQWDNVTGSIYVTEAKSRKLTPEYCSGILGKKVDTAPNVKPIKEKSWDITKNRSLAFISERNNPNIALVVGKNERLIPFIYNKGEFNCGSAVDVWFLDNNNNNQRQKWYIKKTKNGETINSPNINDDIFISVIKKNTKFTFNFNGSCGNRRYEFSLRGSSRALGNLLNQQVSSPPKSPPEPGISRSNKPSQNHMLNTSKPSPQIGEWQFEALRGQGGSVAHIKAKNDNDVLLRVGWMKGAFYPELIRINKPFCVDGQGDIRNRAKVKYENRNKSKHEGNWIVSKKNKIQIFRPKNENVSDLIFFIQNNDYIKIGIHLCGTKEYSFSSRGGKAALNRLRK
jgi:hypothetical protein